MSYLTIYKTALIKRGFNNAHKPHGVMQKDITYNVMSVQRIFH